MGMNPIDLFTRGQVPGPARRNPARKDPPIGNPGARRPRPQGSSGEADFRRASRAMPPPSPPPSPPQRQPARRTTSSSRGRTTSSRSRGSSPAPPPPSEAPVNQEFLDWWENATEEEREAFIRFVNLTPEQQELLILDEQTREFLEQAYGYLAAYIEHPEIGPILLQAAKEGWSEARLRGALHATNWWRETQESARLFDAEESSDPATVQAKIEARKAQIAEQVKQLQFEFDDETLTRLARESIRLNWNADQMMRALRAEAAKDPALAERVAKGRIGRTLRQIAQSYGIPMAGPSVAEWARRIALGEATEEEFDAAMREQAKLLYPGLANQFDAGATMDQLMNPYLQVAASELGINPAAISPTDPLYLSALQGPDGRPLSLDEWRRMLRKDPRFGWQFSQNANNEAAALGETLLRMFGKVA